MKTNNAERKILKPIRKLSTILVMIVLLPALIYTAYEFNSLSENEKLLSKIYTQQLDAILFSVNQYAWDYVNTWVVDFEKFRQTSNPDSIFKLLKNDKSIILASEIDTSFSHYFIHTENSEIKYIDIGNKILKKLKSQENIYEKLKSLKKQGYKRIETISFEENDELSGESIIFVFIPDYAKEYKRMVYFLASSTGIIDVISKRLSSIASGQFKVGIFDKTNKSPVFSNEPFRYDEIKHKKNIWIFPNYFLGISLKGESIENILHQRFLFSLTLIIIVDVLMLFGVWLIIRTMKKQFQLTKLKTDFVSNVSHELRTPLALIRMYAETLEMGRIPSEEKKNTYYNTIKQESERLTRLINNILNFSKIESDKKQYNFNQVNLNETVYNILEIYKFHLQNQGFEITTNFDENNLVIKADEEAISEAFINLIDNAIKYSGEIKKITITTGKQNNNIFLEITDSGIGIIKNNQKFIFDEFYRVSTSSTFTTKGSGLGLSLVKHIMDAHEGNIEVESELGKGSTFRLNFME